MDMLKKILFAASASIAVLGLSLAITIAVQSVPLESSKRPRPTRPDGLAEDGVLRETEGLS
jgi:hypothetical protein